MIKKFTLLLLAMLCIGGVNAKTNPKETELLDGAWTASWTAKSFDAQSGAKVGDVIRIHVTHTYSGSGWDYSQFNITNQSGGDIGLSGTKSYAKSSQSNIDENFDYEITNASDLEIIQISGFGLAGDGCIITSVKLITYDESYDAVPMTIGSDGIATWSSSKNADFSRVSGVTPYYASEVSKGQVTLTAVESTRAWVGYIVKGDEGTYDVPVGPEPAWIDAFNNLVGTGDNAGKVYKSVYSGYTKQESWETDAQVTNIQEKYRYIFAKHGSDIGFYLLPTGYSEVISDVSQPYHPLAAHKAYLETDTDLSADAPTLSMGSRSYMRLSFGGGGGTTAINTALKNPIVEDGLYYTLQGVAVKNPSKGIYILNGKKVFVK